MSDWRDIETAPKDGTRILVARNGIVFDTKWHKCITYRTGEPDEITQGWQCGAAPTHWMPLPAPPTEGAR